MKFATAILNFSRSKGGAERYLVDLCVRMAKEGHDVHVYAEDWEEDIPGISLHRVKTIPFPKSLRLLSFANKATKKMKNGGYDITLGVGNTLEADVLQPHGGVHRAWFWRSLKAYDHPVLWTIKLLGRILSPKQWVQGYIESRPYKEKNFGKIIAISDMVKQDILRWYGISKDHLEVVYNGVDIERFHPGNRQFREEIRRRHDISDEFVILFVSNNFRMKGLQGLIKALASIKQEGISSFRLLVLGRDRRKPYFQLARRLRVSEEVIFVGSTGEPEKYYGASDLLVHPTFYDACSLTVMEALASGLPVITTSSNGASGMITHGEDGWIIFDPADEKDLREALRYFFDGKYRVEASEKARQKAEMNSAENNYQQMMFAFKKSMEK